MEELSTLLYFSSHKSNRFLETIGNGMKSLFSRLQNIKVGKYLSDEGEALNDTEKVLNSLGVKLRDSATAWRDPMEVLDEVGKKWKDLTDVDRSAIATALNKTGAIVA